MVVSLQYLIFLVLSVGTIADMTNWYQMNTAFGPITMENGGWAKPAGNGEEPTLFQDFPHNGQMYIMIMSGYYKGSYLGGHYDNGVGAWKNWIDAGYMSWDGCKLKSKSGKTSNYEMVYRSTGYFYFYAVGNQYASVCITKVYPYRPSTDPVCKANAVNGSWEYMQMLSEKTSLTVTHGTNKRFAESKTTEWSHAVSATSEVSLGIKTFHEVKIGLSYEFRRAITRMYENEWSMNNEESWSHEFGGANQGKALWQFVFHIRDDCDHEERTLVPEFAITNNAREPPCCLPGHTNDGLSYTNCTSEDDRIEKTIPRCVAAANTSTLLSSCTANAVKGSWKYKQTLIENTSVMVTHGTDKRFEDSKTMEWSHSVSAMSESSLRVWSLPGTDIGVDSDNRKAITQMYANEWCLNKEESWTHEFGEENKGKALWQFVFDIRDNCDHEERTLVSEFAITNSACEPPCCLPGRTNDGLSYTNCTSEDDRIEKTLSHCVAAVNTSTLLPPMN